MRTEHENLTPQNPEVTSEDIVISPQSVVPQHQNGDETPQSAVSQSSTVDETPQSPIPQRPNGDEAPQEEAVTLHDVQADEFRSYDMETGEWIGDDEVELFGPSDFEVDFDYDAVCKNVPTDSPIRVRREKRTGVVGGFLYAIFVISISILLGSLVWMGAADVLGFATEEELINVTVPRDFDIEDIVEMLFDAGLIRYRFLFREYARISNAADIIMPGSYFLCRSFDYRALVHGMTHRVGIREEVIVTIPEGLTLSQVFRRLEDNGVTPAEDLWEAATYHNFNFPFLDSSTIGDRHRLEGFLFPDTYNFFVESTPVEALSRMLRQFNRVFDEDMVERAEELGYSVRDIVIIASMIEREAGSDEERPRIAAVIYNRLYQWDNPILQIDATIVYAIMDTGQPFSTTIDSPFNTYIHPGLPPGPIASPGLASIRAALHPDETDEFFYALNLEGTHNFFRTYAEHSAFVESDQFGGR